MLNGTKGSCFLKTHLYSPPFVLHIYVNGGIQMQPPFKSVSVHILIAKNVLMNTFHLQFDLCCHISPRLTGSEIKCSAG